MTRKKPARKSIIPKRFKKENIKMILLPKEHWESFVGVDRHGSYTKFRTLELEGIPAICSSIVDEPSLVISYSNQGAQGR